MVNGIDKKDYENKTDHEAVLLLEEQTIAQEKAIEDLRNSLVKSQRENAHLLKFERLLLVLLGILSSAVVALYDSRGNGNGG